MSQHDVINIGSGEDDDGSGDDDDDEDDEDDDDLENAGMVSSAFHTPPCLTHVQYVDDDDDDDEGKSSSLGRSCVQ
jgi:hypothetical protein